MAIDPEREGIQPYRKSIPSDSPEKPQADEGIVDVALERSSTLLGKQISEKRQWPWVAIFSALYGIIGLVFSIIYKTPDMIFGFSVPILIYAAWLLITRPPLQKYQFDQGGITFLPSNYFLPYHQIFEIFAPKQEMYRTFTIYLLCEGGHFILTPKTESEEIYQFLKSQPLGRPTIPDDLDRVFNSFLRQQIAVHGPNEILIYQRPKWIEWQLIRKPWRFNPSLRTSLGLLMVGALAWTALAITHTLHPSLMPWLIWTGIVTTSLGLIIAAFSRRSAWTRKKKLQNATLILSPSGLALSQGELKGELRWSEIRKVRLQKASFNHSHPGTTNGPGVLIDVAGAQLKIHDIYHWPAVHIDWLIRHHYSN